MSKLLSFEFLFRARQYYAFARVKPTEEGNEYHVSVMDQEIEKIFQGEIKLTEKQGRIIPPNISLSGQEGKILNSSVAEQDRAMLFQSIITALQQRTNESNGNTGGLN